MPRGFVVILAMALAACQTDSSNVKNQTAALSLAPESLGQRQNEMRRFDTKDEAFVLSAASAVMQDLGFTIEESSAKAGLIVASKDRDAVEAGQVTSAIMLAVLISALGGKADPVWEKNQKIRLSLATRSAANGNGTVVRVTFQRVIWNTKNQISRVESINEPVIYREFFDKLSQSLFLEAHQI
jgi:hypothetical protein